MSKISIVGVEGSGKTTLMAAFGEQYERPDEYGYGLRANDVATFRHVKTLAGHMRHGRWPSATELGSLVNLVWTLYRREGASVEKICEVACLDFAGEVYRNAFVEPADGGAGNGSLGDPRIVALQEHIRNSDALVVLVNLKDVIDGDLSSERTVDMLWVTQRILDFAIDTCGIGHVALAFSQFEAYREIVESDGGLRAAFAKYLPHIEGVRPDLQLMALSAVDRTKVDGNGDEVPAPDFSSHGLGGLLEWILSTVPGHEDDIRHRRELPQILWYKVKSLHDAIYNGDGSVDLDSFESVLDRFRAFPAKERGDVASEGEIEAMVDFLRTVREEDQYADEVLNLAKGGGFDEALHKLEDYVASGVVLSSRAKEIRSQIEKWRYGHKWLRVLSRVGSLALVAVLAVVWFSFWVDGEEDRTTLAPSSSASLIDSGLIPAPKSGQLPMTGSYAGQKTTISLPGGVKMEMVWCPPGIFMMGSPDSEKVRDDDENQHRVTLTQGFWMCETEVTQGQWKKLMGGETVRDLARKALQDDTLYNIAGKQQTLRDYWGLSRDADPDSRCGDLNDKVPVYNVSWHEAKEFCRRLTAQEREAGRLPDGYEYRLPTEAEWEYACRARTTTALPNGQDIHIVGKHNAPALDQIAWYGGNSSVGFSGRGCDTSGWKEKQYEGGRAFVREVRGKRPNEWGLYDMIGNVWEWCEDGYDSVFYTKEAARVDPCCASGSYRVIRGGSWRDFAQFSRSANRSGNEPGYRNGSLGFRLVCSAGPRR